jgi:hypothetical protein
MDYLSQSLFINYGVAVVGEDCWGLRWTADCKAGSPEHISARPAVQRGGGTADKVVTLGGLFVPTKNFRGRPTDLGQRQLKK